MLFIKTIIKVFCISIILINLLASCSSSLVTPDASGAVVTSGFQLRMPMESFNGGSVDSWAVQSEQQGNDLNLHIQVSGAEAILGYGVEIEYDTSSWRYLSVDDTGKFGGRDEVIIISGAQGKGGLLVGLSVKNSTENTGFSGSARLATLRFRRISSE